MDYSNLSAPIIPPELQSLDTTWQRDLEAMFSQPADYTFSQFGDAIMQEQIPIGTVDPGMQTNWHDFMMQMIQAPADFFK